MEDVKTLARAIVTMCSFRVYQRDGLVDSVAEMLRDHAATQRRELEAARAVVEAANEADGAYQHAYLCAGGVGGVACSCGLDAFRSALDAYDAAKAGKAVE